MRHTRFPVVPITFSVFVGSFLVSPSLIRERAQYAGSSGDVTPILRLEKPKYLLGEAIRFLVGVEPKNLSEIPREAWKPCSLEIKKPDGSTETQSVGWPTDGPPGRGWSGGWGFGDAAVEAGSYILVLQCGSEKTQPLELIVEKNDVYDQIKAEFRFERSGAIKIGTPVSVILTVQNHSQNRIRFPQRGSMGEGVILEVLRDEPAMRSAFFYPWEKLGKSTSMPDTYSWDSDPDIPSVILRPGERFEQRFAIEDAYSFDQPGNYEVTFATALAVLVGDKHGPFADLCPIRLAVKGRARFALSN